MPNTQERRPGDVWGAGDQCMRKGPMRSVIKVAAFWPDKRVQNPTVWWLISPHGGDGGGSWICIMIGGETGLGSAPLPPPLPGLFTL